MAVLDLTRSEARRRLLSLFFADPAREHHLRGLVRRIGMSIGAVQNVVGKLEREGLLRRRTLGNLALFSLNRRHPLYADLEGLVAKTIGIAPRLARALSALDGVRIAFVYGSYVTVFSKTGSAWGGESDVDLMVIGTVDPRAVGRIARECGVQTGRQVNYTVLGAGELAGRIARRESFLQDVLAKPILPLAGFPDTECTTPIRLKPGDFRKLLERRA